MRGQTGKRPAKRGVARLYFALKGLSGFPAPVARLLLAHVRHLVSRGPVRCRCASQKARSMVKACSTCGCNDFQPNLFKAGYCKECLHPHEETEESKYVPVARR